MRRSLYFPTRPGYYLSINDFEHPMPHRLCETGSILFKPEAYLNFTILSLSALYIPFFMSPFLKNFLIPFPGAPGEQI